MGEEIRGEESRWEESRAGGNPWGRSSVGGIPWEGSRAGGIPMESLFTSVIFTHRPPLFAPLNFFLLQFLRFPVINIPFIGIRQKEFLNFIEKHGRYELLNVKNCFFGGGKFFSIFGKLLTILRHLKKIPEDDLDPISFFQFPFHIE